MRMVQRAVYLTSLVSLLVLAAGCAYNTAVQRLPPPEQAAFRAYKNVMSGKQAWTYLDKASPAERQAYLQEIGVAQRFQALDPQDREAVLLGYPRQGMSTEALTFLWGEPVRKRGNGNHYAHWHYWGSTMTLAMRGNDTHSRSNFVTVEVVDGRVTWWMDYVPTSDDKDDKGDRRSM